MYKFIKKIFIYFFLCFTATIIIIFTSILLKENHYYDYPAALVDKYNRLEKLQNHQKIIIAGGSSSCYSIASEALSNKFNLPVVNTSLAMSLGSTFQLFHFKDYIKEGDIILYFPEYESYYGNIEGGDFLLSAFFYYPKIFKDYNILQRFNFFKNSIKLSINGSKNFLLNDFLKAKKIDAIQYSRLAYNLLGDNTSLLEKKESIFDRNNKNRFEKLPSKLIEKEYIKILKDFKVLCKEKEATFILGFPPLAKNDYDKQFAIDAKKIEKETKLFFLGEASQNVFADSLFYDSSYHMNGLGRPLRTNQLLKDLTEANILK